MTTYDTANDNKVGIMFLSIGKLKALLFLSVWLIQSSEFSEWQEMS